MSTTMIETTKGVNNNQFFNFEEAKVQALTLEQLERTHRENDVYEKPLRGIYHFALIHQLIDMCNEIGYNVEIYDLFAANNKDRTQPGVVRLPQIEQIKGERAIEAHILRRVFANIRITDFDNEETTTNLSVAYHQKGIQVGFGPNVIICHNQCMLGAQYYGATYGDKGKGKNSANKYELPELLDVVKSWLVDARHIIVTEREKIERMKNIEVTADKLLVIIGMLTAIRVKCDSTNKLIHEHRTYPLNQAQINSLTERLLIKYEEQKHISLWNLYNAATDMYKVQQMDTPMIMPQNIALSELLQEQFNFAF